MAMNSVITITTGVPGAGKTYVRAARFLVDDFLINSNGIHISNFPLNIDAISETVYKKLHRGGKISRFFGIKHNKTTLDDIKKRIEIIPDIVLQSWKWERSGPWDYFRGRDLRYCHIAIDEIHNFLSDNKSSEYLQRWDDWLGEVRHMGCTFEGLTQDITQVAQCLVGRASIRLEIVPLETVRDPYFNIPLGDWYELKASLTGEYHKTVCEVEKRKTDRRFVTNSTRRFLVVPEYFKYYNSFSASLSEKADGVQDENRAPLYEYQKRSRLSLLFWFCRRNFLSLFFRFFFVILFLWIAFFGGFSFLFDGFISYMNSSVKSNKLDNPQKDNASVFPAKDNSSLVVPVTDSELQKLKSDRETEKKRLEEEKKKKADEERLRFEKDYRISFLTKDYVIFANGKGYKSGDVIDDEKNPLCHGKRVEKINFSDRAVSFGGSFVLRM